MTITAKDFKNKAPRILLVGVSSLKRPIKAIFVGSFICIKAYNEQDDHWKVINTAPLIDTYERYFEVAYTQDTDYEFAKLLTAHGVNINYIRR